MAEIYSQFKEERTYPQTPAETRKPTEDIEVEQEFTAEQLANIPEYAREKNELILAQKESQRQAKRFANFSNYYEQLAARLEIDMAVEQNSDTRFWCQSLQQLADIQKKRAEKLARLHDKASQAKNIFDYDDTLEDAFQLEQEFRVGEKLFGENLDSLEAQKKPVAEAAEIAAKRTREKATTRLVRDLGETIYESDMAFSVSERQFHQQLNEAKNPDLLIKERTRDYEELAHGINKLVDDLNALTAHYDISPLNKFSWVEGESAHYTYFKYVKELELHLHGAYSLMLTKVRPGPLSAINNLYKTFSHLQTDFNKLLTIIGPKIREAEPAAYPKPAPVSASEKATRAWTQN